MRNFSNFKIIISIAVALILALMIPSATAKIRTTDAAWTSSPNTNSASFQAAQIGSIQNLKCFDSNSGGLIGTDLLDGDLLFTWTPPQGFENKDIDYKVTWDPGLLGTKGEALVTGGATQYRFDVAILTTLLSGRINFEITPLMASWQGDSAKWSAKGLVVLVSLRISCS